MVYCIVITRKIFPLNIINIAKRASIYYEDSDKWMEVEDNLKYY
jgi:hypothetical protein